MCKKLGLFVAVALLLVGSVVEVSAQAPETILYQGRLTNADGVPIDTTTEVTFNIYSTPSGLGILYYDTTAQITPDASGVFTIELGPLNQADFVGVRRYLGIKVGTENEMTPRQVLTSVPYAFAAENIPNSSVTSNKLAAGAVTSEAIASDAVYDSKILDEAGVEYVNGSSVGTQISLEVGSWVTLGQLSVTYPATGYVVLVGTGHADWDISSWTGEVYVGWSTSSTTTPSYYNRLSLSTADVSTYIPITAMYTYNVSGSGTTTYYLMAYATSGTDTDMDFFRGSMTAMYFPTRY